MKALTAVIACVAASMLALAHPSAAASPEAPTSEQLSYALSDPANLSASWGRIIGPGGQLRNPAYLAALAPEGVKVNTSQLLLQLRNPLRLSLTAGNLFPGWNVGNPLRAGWSGTRGIATDVAFTNRHGALLRGTVFTPKPGAIDPYTGERLVGPFPGVVVTPGSVQGSGRMYHWLGQDLAERGYVVLVYDVQGEGTSETLPNEPVNGLPFCNPLAPPQATEMLGCPGVPFQQPANFVKGTQDATDFFFSTPARPYPNRGSAGAVVDAHNPMWQQFDRSADPAPATPGRVRRFAIIGHSLGAAAVSFVQGIDDRVATTIALDKLQSGAGGDRMLDVGDIKPRVPALGIQSEYGFVPTPYVLSGGNSITPTPGLPERNRERATGFDAWRTAGLDTAVIVPRASTHLEYTDIPLVLPASRYGQALSSVYAQAWLDRYLKHRPAAPLLRDSFGYLEPQGKGVWKRITLPRDSLLSQRYCSAVDIGTGSGRSVDADLGDIGGCRP